MPPLSLPKVSKLASICAEPAGNPINNVAGSQEGAHLYRLVICYHKPAKLQLLDPCEPPSIRTCDSARLATPNTSSKISQKLSDDPLALPLVCAVGVASRWEIRLSSQPCCVLKEGDPGLSGGQSGPSTAPLFWVPLQLS